VENLLEIAVLEAAFEPEAENAGVQRVLIGRKLEEIIENPVLIGSWLLRLSKAFCVRGFTVAPP